ncbi:hypothetical protein CICLE_v10033111mg [Citrus x clementina]|uniref:WAT1-related protein n=1 Tax=Citrus clementina TaxID=85681 RepID=V4TJC6_CITCL|nr:hypothetical protein CICLE_v10033111mg [Citrus x clementina]ESR51686.1 hypothetical protein CICLE_v10033111mg [Citrus x clementina]
MKMCAICVISSEYACSCCGQMFHYFGIENGSPALASAMIDLTPGFTFILAIIFSFVGAATIALGFYAVIWGQAKEEKVDEDHTEISGFKPSSPCVPLLINKSNTEDSRATFASG